MERVRWAREVVRLREEKKTWPEVATIVGKSQATCKRLAASQRDTGDPDAPADAMSWVWERFDVLRVVMDEASKTYDAAPEGSSVRVGALKRFDEASAGIIELASRVGFLPRRLGYLGAEREMQQVFREFAELLQDHGASDALIGDLLHLAEARLAHGAPAIEGQSRPAA